MKQRGMTLIEMLILASIAGIIIAVALPMLTSGPHVKYGDSHGCAKPVQQETKPQGF